MPPERRRRKGKGEASDHSEAPSDATMGPPSTLLPRVRLTESELSTSEGNMEDAGKRFKPGTPLAIRAATTGHPAVGDKELDGNAASAASSAGTAVAAPAAPKVRESRPRRRMASDDDVIGEKKALTTSLLEEVMMDGVSQALGRSVLLHSGCYEVLLMRLLAENERLRWWTSGCPSDGCGNICPCGEPSRSGAVSGFARCAGGSPEARRDWSVVVKGKKGVSSSEVVEKAVGRTLWVRVHELKPTRDGGAVIKTPSVAEREKVAANAKCGEVGLELSVKDKLGPKVVVQRVHPEITQEEFMGFQA